MTGEAKLNSNNDFIAARKKRSLFIAAGLIAFVAVIYFVSMVRMSEAVKAKQAAESNGVPLQTYNNTGQ